MQKEHCAGTKLYVPTEAEAAAIRRGRAEVERGEYVSLSQLRDELDAPRQQKRKKTTRKNS